MGREMRMRREAELGARGREDVNEDELGVRGRMRMRREAEGRGEGRMKGCG